jgi:hypothetical protein
MASAFLLMSLTHPATMMISPQDKVPLRFFHSFKPPLMMCLRRSRESTVIPSLKSIVFMFSSTSSNLLDSGKFVVKVGTFISS